MKHIYLFLFPVIVLLSCQKEMQQQKTSYITNVEASLKDSLAAQDYNSLEFESAVLSKTDNAALYFLRIPFKGKKLQNDFVLVQTSSDGKIQRGKVVHLEGGQAEFGDGKIKRRRFEGSIEISSLDRKATLHSVIKKGYIQAFHQRENTRTSVVPEEDILPEVIVVAYVSPNYGISFSDWMYLQSLFYSSPFDYSTGIGESGGNGGTYYGSLDGSGGGYYGGSGTSDPNSGMLQDPLILVDYEWQADNTAIEIEKYLKCFDAIPDAGATCSIEIFTDIPVDTDPNKLFDFNSGSPGHTFFQIKKANGTKSVIQNIGFYPKTGWKTALTNAPIDGKFVDNANHEFNASLKMNLSPDNFKSTLTEIQYLSRFVQYDIDNYNCTDFALDVFNKARTNKLQIPLYDLPGNYPSTGTRTPQGLFNKLQEMKKANAPEASNITIGFQKGWVANSTGPCN